MGTFARTSGRRPTTVWLVDGDTEVLICPLDGREPDLAMVDALLRMHLDARRRGRSLRLGDVSPELAALLRLLGFAEVLGLEAGREAELGEQLGIQEVVEPDDAPA